MDHGLSQEADSCSAGHEILLLMAPKNSFTESAGAHIQVKAEMNISDFFFFFYQNYLVLRVLLERWIHMIVAAVFCSYCNVKI